ncbi:MAG: SMP-30/gluconolactonase/LRE family protein, partial [Candidatus Corynebacterium faecigallinarum]
MSETTPHDSASPADRPTREVRTVLTGRHFTECPRWHDDRWYFVDFYSHTVHSMAADGSDLGTELEVPQQPSGLGWLPDGRLLVVSMKDRRILRR